MNTKRALITGGSGDLGGRLIPLLRGAGYEVANLDPTPTSSNGVISITGSILDRTIVSEAVAKSDIIVHIAAWHGLHAFTRSRSPYEFWDLNMTGTFNLLEAAAQRGVKNFIFISSTSIDEWPELYGTTKLLGEQLCRSYSERADMKVLCLRPRAFIPWWNTSVYSSFEEWATWFMRGSVHIDDVAQAVLLACETALRTSVDLYEVIEVDGKRELSDMDIRDWTSRGGKRILATLFPEYAREIERAPFISDTPPTFKDTRKAIQTLGYRPQYGIRELLQEYANLTDKRAHDVRRSEGDNVTS